jgi:hypothetical protein
MLPEPTLPKRRRAAPGAAAQPQPWAMTPLFAVPDSPDALSPPEPPGGRPAARPPGRGRRPNSRSARPGNSDSARTSNQEPPDLLTVTAERLRRALGRSFLRYGMASDLETAVHAAMNVVEPVLDARDGEILRLRRLVGAKLPNR